MAKLSRSALTSVLLGALRASGAVPVLLSTAGSNPRRIRVLVDGESYTISAYLWNCTYGGAPRDPNELRVQITARPPLDRSGDITVLLGYHADLDVFAAWDAVRHEDFESESPSLQIQKGTLERAADAGLAFQSRANGETAIAFRPELLLTYLQHSRPLHEFGDSVLEDVLGGGEATGTPVEDGDVGLEVVNRAVLSSIVKRRVRNANFRHEVLAAYDNRCAITGLNLGIVHAAHIVPVTDDFSADTVQNGIALSPTFHAAFDAGIIYLDENYEMVLDEDVVEGLKSRGLDVGLDYVREHLGLIRLPASRTDWPAKAYIRRSKELRRQRKI